MVTKSTTERTVKSPPCRGSIPLRKIRKAIKKVVGERKINPDFFVIDINKHEFVDELIGVIEEHVLEFDLFYFSGKKEIIEDLDTWELSKKVVYQLINIFRKHGLNMRDEIRREDNGEKENALDKVYDNAEEKLLGAVMLDNESFEKIEPILSPFDFSQARHRTIFKVMKKLDADKRPIDILEVMIMLREQNKLGEIGGEKYLFDLAKNCPTSDPEYLIRWAKVIYICNSLSREDRKKEEKENGEINDKEKKESTGI